MLFNSLVIFFSNWHEAGDPPGISYLEMKGETNENFPFSFVDDNGDLTLGAFLSVS